MHNPIAVGNVDEKEITVRPFGIVRTILLAISTLAVLNSQLVALASTEAESDMTTKLSTGTGSLAFRLLAKLAAAHPASNLLISPTSLATALTLAYNGAGGKTASEMSDTLGLTGLSLDEVDRAMAALTKSVEDADPKVQLISANALWVKNGIKLKSAFSGQAKKYFRSQVSNLDFADPGSVSVINKWVAEQTKDKIKSIINSLDSASLLVLTNAVYFKGAWTKPFNASATEENGEFKLAGGARLKIAMMQQSGRFLYGEDANVQALELPYGNGQISMFILLPKAQSDFQNFLTGMTLKGFEKTIDKLQVASGSITLPRFSISYENELSKDFKSLGMPTAFDPRAADFKAMADVPSSFFIGQVLHKAIMNVNEAGTEAAAATAIIMATAAYIPGKPFVMNVDHPFVVAIRERDSKQILFLGAVANPEKLAAPKSN